MAFKTLALYAEVWLAARLIPFRARSRDFRQILSHVDAGESRRYAGVSAQRIAAAVKRVTRRPILMRKRRCFREGLLGYRFLRLAGYEPQLHFSVRNPRPGESRMAAHCWVVLDGEAIVNDALAEMTTILVHPRKSTAG